MIWRPHTEQPAPDQRCTALVAVQDEDGFVFLLPRIYAWNGCDWHPENEMHTGIKYPVFWWMVEADLIAGLGQGGLSDV